MKPENRSSNSFLERRGFRVSLLLLVLLGALSDAGLNYTRARELDRKVELADLGHALPNDVAPAKLARYVLLVADLRSKIRERIRYEMLFATVVAILTVMELARWRRERRRGHERPDLG